MPVEWTEDLAVGVDVIDDQHKELFRRVDGLIEACKAGKGKEAVAEVLAFLEDYIVTHFSAEENLQLHYSYPNYKLHKAMHEGFIDDVKKLKAKFEVEGASLDLALETNRVVVSWLVRHIKRADMELGEYLRAHGYVGELP